MLFSNLFLSNIVLAQACVKPPQSNEDTLKLPVTAMTPVSSAALCENSNANYVGDEATRYYKFNDLFKPGTTTPLISQADIATWLQTCKSPKALYVVVTLKSMSPISGTAVWCNLAFGVYCDPAGKPTEPGYSGTCAPTPVTPPINPNPTNPVDPTTPSEPCGNASLDTGEACDLGELNSDDPTNNFGCKKNCTKHTGWECTKNLEEYNIRVKETEDLYLNLISASTQNLFIDNNCSAFNTGDAAKELVCANYQETLKTFKTLNATIKIQCTAVTSLMQRAPGIGQPMVRYVVNCLP